MCENVSLRTSTNSEQFKNGFLLRTYLFGILILNGYIPTLMGMPNETGSEGSLDVKARYPCAGVRALRTPQLQPHLCLEIAFCPKSLFHLPIVDIRGSMTRWRNTISNQSCGDVGYSIVLIRLLQPCGTAAGCRIFRPAPPLITALALPRAFGLCSAPFPGI
jgi:hypothetical protein